MNGAVIVIARAGSREGSKRVIRRRTTAVLRGAGCGYTPGNRVKTD